MSFVYVLMVPMRDRLHIRLLRSSRKNRVLSPNQKDFRLLGELVKTSFLPNQRETSM